MDREVIVKAVLHVHSNWSYDGKWTLSQISHFFSKTGYNLVFTAEHDETFDNDRWQTYQEACRTASTDKILLIPGIEYSDESNTVHILVWGIKSFLGRKQPTGFILKKANELKGVCVLAHPTRRQAWQHLDVAWLPLLCGLELWNRKTDGIAPSREAISLLEANTNMNPFVGLDFHRYNQLFPLSMRLKVNGSLSLDSVYNALRAGNYQASALGLPVTYFKKKPLLSCVMTAELLRKTVLQLKGGKKK